MSSLIDSAEIREAITPMSVAFYHASSDLGWIDENTELLQGIPVRKMSKSPEHEFLVSLFLRMIEAVIPDGFFVIKERPLTTSDSEPEPDLMVVAGDELDFRTMHPTTAALIVEVSISTQDRDKKKAEIYSAAGVGEYWIVDPDSRSITVFTDPAPEGYIKEKVFSDPTTVTPQSLPDLKIQVPAIFD